jgi:hypothetical protein
MLIGLSFLFVFEAVFLLQKVRSANERPWIKLKTRPTFCPPSLSLSKTLTSKRNVAKKL